MYQFIRKLFLFFSLALTFFFWGGVSNIHVTLCRKWSFMPTDLYPCVKNTITPNTGGYFQRLESTIYYTNLMRWKNSLLELGNQAGSK